MLSASYTQPVAISHAPATITATSTSTADATDPITAYKWDFGDGSGQQTGTSTQSHTYAQPGTYAVELEVSTQSGAADSSARQQIIILAPMPDVVIETGGIESQITDLHGIFAGIFGD